jgi:DNA (cytosine-5)-methyltransferase 1
MIHLDLFSGIGGFAYAADQVFGDVEHIFCDNEPFAQKVIAKHWPESRIYGDIRSITKPIKADIVTGGFPCQGFSSAGKKRGTEDKRYLWPEMFRVIQLTKPEWVIAENVSGILTWGEGLVFDKVCSDLESEGYEVQPFIIPAIAVNAPHRRDRVWFIARNTEYTRQYGTKDAQSDTKRTDGNKKRAHQSKQLARSNSIRPKFNSSWNTHWNDLATRVCRVDDGLPNRVDRIKGLGNAIVPQVAMEIMKGMI